eukprot:scaffold1642_cov252-Pinguiococcus_pyrenoidosus.AAC.37
MDEETRETPPKTFQNLYDAPLPGVSIGRPVRLGLLAKAHEPLREVARGHTAAKRGAARRGARETGDPSGAQ